MKIKLLFFAVVGVGCNYTNREPEMHQPPPALVRQASESTVVRDPPRNPIKEATEEIGGYVRTLSEGRPPHLEGEVPLGKLLSALYDGLDDYATTGAALAAACRLKAEALMDVVGNLESACWAYFHAANGNGEEQLEKLTGRTLTKLDQRNGVGACLTYLHAAMKALGRGAVPACENLPAKKNEWWDAGKKN